jgi:four helix bundle protein
MEDLKILERSFLFSLKIIELYKNLTDQKEYIISSQLLRSATSIGANVHEASAAFSKKEFAHKMSIASKEARETDYWLKLLKQGNLTRLNLDQYIEEINNIINITTAIVKTKQKKLADSK